MEKFKKIFPLSRALGKSPGKIVLCTLIYVMIAIVVTVVSSQLLNLIVNAFSDISNCVLNVLISALNGTVILAPIGGLTNFILQISAPLVRFFNCLIIFLPANLVAVYCVIGVYEAIKHYVDTKSEGADTGKLKKWFPLSNALGKSSAAVVVCSLIYLSLLLVVAAITFAVQFVVDTILVVAIIGIILLLAILLIPILTIALFIFGLIEALLCISIIGIPLAILGIILLVVIFFATIFVPMQIIVTTINFVIYIPCHLIAIYGILGSYVAIENNLKNKNPEV